MIVDVLTTCHTQYTWDRCICIFYLIEKLSKFLLYTVQLLYIRTLCDSTNINTIIEFVPNCFNGGSNSYLQFRDTQVPCLLKLYIPPSNEIVRWWLFPQFRAELSLDNCTRQPFWIGLYNCNQALQFIWWQVIKKIIFTLLLTHNYHLNVGLHRFP